MPVLLGLPWLAAVLGSLFTGLVTWLAQFITKRVAVIVAAIVALTSLTATFIGLAEAALGGLSYAFPVAANLGFMLPGDLSALAGSYAAIRLAHWVYSWNVKIVQLRLF